MLPELLDYKDLTTLISNTGVQFLDFGFSVEKREADGSFVLLNNKHVTLLAQDEDDNYFYNYDTADEFNLRQRAQPGYELRLQDSLKLLNGLWLPLPFLRYSNARYDEGPSNWARMRFIELAEPDFDGNTHRITLAFDTMLMNASPSSLYLAPTAADVAAPSLFKLALNTNQITWFFDQEWVSNWLREIYEYAYKDDDDLALNLKQQHPIAHYLNVLKLLGPIAHDKNTHQPKIHLPQIKLIDHTGQNSSVIPVDLVLDVGNSRTCGILVENHKQAGTGLMQNTLLQLRDLSHPERIYDDPFESRIEFHQALLGKDNWSRKSGRVDAFSWPSFVRVGHEAGHLASHRQGSEGSTGLSSPKRYLWDKNSYEHGWVFNGYGDQKGNQPALTLPLSNYIDGEGEALYTYSDEDFDFAIPVLQPKYSRSSLMTLMLIEVIAQALNQMNSASHRLNRGLSDHPRQLHSITLTVPPGMPLAERSILTDRLSQALGLIWKCMKWHEGDYSPYEEPNESATASAPPAKPIPPLPKIHVEWDEASCGQLVYLYSEIANNFAHQPEEFFASLARPDKNTKNKISLATIDIGGGTTDLVITQYHLNGQGNNAHIIPTQLFRDGFKIAGDDILLDVIQKYVLPSFAQALRLVGVTDTDSVLSALCGSQTTSASDSVLRQQLNLQVFTPIGLAILSLYENYDAFAHDPLSRHYTYEELLGDNTPSQAVIDYVHAQVRKAHADYQSLNLNTIGIDLDFKKIHQQFIDLQSGFNINQTLQALSEVIFQYDCDLLLLTGRPSRLPGIQALLRMLLPLAPGRILPLHNYKAGSWYPFHKNQRIDDPKTTASVGALLCLLSHESRLQNFFFRVSELKPYSTIRYFGLINGQNTIPENDILFHNIQTEIGDKQTEKIVLPVDPTTDLVPALEVRNGDYRLGFRQLATPRWTASPLYTLQLTPEAVKKYNEATVIDVNLRSEPVVFVRFKVKDQPKKRFGNSVISDQLEIDSVETNTNKNFNKRDVKLQLNTMPDSNHIYWLDSGSVKNS